MDSCTALHIINKDFDPAESRHGTLCNVYTYKGPITWEGAKRAMDVHWPEQED